MKVLKFYATWCGPCKMLTPQMEIVKEKFPDIKFEDIDVDARSDVASDYEVMSVPTVIFIKGGRQIGRFSGFKPADFIEEKINQLKLNF